MIRVRRLIVAKVASYYADPTWATMGDKSLAVKLKEDVENALASVPTWMASA